MDTWLMPIHIAGGSIAIIGGYVAVFAKKGGQRPSQVWTGVRGGHDGARHHSNGHRRAARRGCRRDVLCCTSWSRRSRPSGRCEAVSGCWTWRACGRRSDPGVRHAKAIDTWMRYGAVHEGVPAGMNSS